MVAWFGLPLDAGVCTSLGADAKGTIIYELELLAAVLAVDLWCREGGECLHVFFCSNDSVRFSFIKASANNAVGQVLLELRLKLESDGDLKTWYARVPTEANISDWPSRGQPNELLKPACDVSVKALSKLQPILRDCYSVDVR